MVTDTLPDVDPQATTAVIDVGLTTLNDVAAVPPKLTAVEAQKLVPVIVTVVPAAADVGLNDDMVGAAVLPVKVNPL